VGLAGIGLSGRPPGVVKLRRGEGGGGGGRGDFCSSQKSLGRRISRGNVLMGIRPAETAGCTGRPSSNCTVVRAQLKLHNRPGAVVPSPEEEEEEEEEREGGEERSSRVASVRRVRRVRAESLLGRRAGALTFRPHRPRWRPRPQVRHAFHATSRRRMTGPSSRPEKIPCRPLPRNHRNRRDLSGEAA